jgi:hypothetical protein
MAASMKENDSGAQGGKHIRFSASDLPQPVRSPSVGPSSGRLLQLDGLRGIAISLVVSSDVMNLKVRKSSTSLASPTVSCQRFLL